MTPPIYTLEKNNESYRNATRERLTKERGIEFVNNDQIRKIYSEL